MIILTRSQTSLNLRMRVYHSSTSFVQDGSNSLKMNECLTVGVCLWSVRSSYNSADALWEDIWRAAGDCWHKKRQK